MSQDRSTVRRILIRRLLAERAISSQGELAELLGKAGHRVTQSTVSRDLSELGATKVGGDSEDEHYVLEDRRRPLDERADQLRRTLEDYLVEAIPSGNLAVLKVRAATAGTVAAAIDAAPPDGVVGTLAGDDTVLIIVEEGVGGVAVTDSIMKILEE